MTDPLKTFFYPSSIAFIGASTDPDKLGGRALFQTLQLGFPGRIFPVNPGSDEVQGQKSFPDIASLPEVPDIAVIVVPARLVEPSIQACADRGVKLSVILSAGFAEQGEEGKKAQDRVVEIARNAGMRLIGPNSMGGLSLETRFSATFTGINQHEGRSWPRTGNISIASQSGFVGSHLMALLRDRGLGVAKWVATGNQVDIDVADAMLHLAKDDITKVIAVYLEATTKPQVLVEALRTARANAKPVVILKAGRTEAGEKAVASHTASLVGGHDVYEAVFRQNGAHAAASLEELVDVVAALDTGRSPPNSEAGIATVSGGFGILSADEAFCRGFALPELNGDAQKELRAKSPLCTTRNPVDMGTLFAFDMATEKLLQQGCGALFLCIGHFGLITRSLPPVFDYLSRFMQDYPDRFVALVACLTDEWKQKFQDIGIFVCEEPTRAVAAAAYVRDMQAVAGRVEDTRVAREAKTGMANMGEFSGAGEREAKQLMERAGIPVVADVLAASAEEARAAAQTFGGRLVLKIASPDIAHKSDMGGVMLGIEGGDEAASAFTAIMARAAKAAPQARLDGVLVSPMIEGGIETIVGVNMDRLFGPAVMFGLGGIFVEVFRDTALRVAPFGIETAHEMIASTQGYQLLKGARGGEEADIDALADAIAKLAAFADANRETIASVEINPLMVLPRGKGVIAVDALVIPQQPPDNGM